MNNDKIRQVTYIDILNEITLKFAGRTAVIDSEGSITYSGLDRLSSAYAYYFTSEGFGRGSKIMVQLENTILFAACYFGMIKAGIVPVLIYPACREKEIHAIAETSSPEGYVAFSRNRGADFRSIAEKAVEGIGSVRKIYFDDELSALDLSAFPEEFAPEVLPAPGDTAVIILSGGSTGIPKLIARTHADHIFTAVETAAKCGFDEDTRFLVSMPVEHNFSLTGPGLVGALCYGGAAVMCRTNSVAEIVKCIMEHKVTSTALVPSLAVECIAYAEKMGFGDAFASMKLVQLGGAVCTPDIIRTVSNKMGCRIQQIYGMGEGIVFCTSYDDDMDIVLNYQGENISAFDDIRIVDAEGRQLPDGEFGELIGKGPCIISGYYNAPEINKVKITPDGFFRTGDRARLVEGKYLQVQGRIDDVINKGGEKISPAEVESMLNSCTGVTESTVFAVSSSTVGEKIAAVVVTADGTGSQVQIRRELAAAGAASYKIPDIICFMAELPTTLAGKIDKNALRKAVLDSLSETVSISEDEPDKSDKRAVVRFVIRKLLGIDDSFDDSATFLELGGQSVLMGNLQNELFERFSVMLPFDKLFAEGSVNGICNMLETERRNVVTGRGDVEFSLSPDKRFETFPITDLQTAYLIGGRSDTLLGGNPTRGYSEIICKDYDNERMETAINRLFAAHDIFRLRIFSDGTQRVEREMEHYSLPFEDISSMSEKEQEAYMLEKRERIFNTLFDTEKLPLVRFCATKLSDEKTVLHFSHDGKIIDGWSHENVIHELDVLYSFPEREYKAPEIQFLDYVNYLEAVKKTDKYKADMDYWMKKADSGHTSPSLPLMCDPSQIKDVSTRQVVRYISQETWEKVRSFAAKSGFTPFALIFTAFGKAISKYSSSKDFLMNMPASVRPAIHPEIDELIGECSNFYIFDFENKNGCSIADTARDNQKQIAEIMQHDYFMGTDFIREMQKRDGGSIVAPIVFTSIIDTPDRESISLRKVYTKTHTSQIWIDAIAMKNNGGIMLIMDCVRELLSSDVTEAIGDTFVRLLELAADQPEFWNESSVAPMLSGELAVTGPCTAEGMGQNGSIPAMMKDVLAKFPDRLVVADSAGELTYRELFRKANCLAKTVRDAAGAESGFRFGVFADKGRLQAIAAAASVILGCPFLPLDITYSAEQVEYTAGCAGLAVIVAEGGLAGRLTDVQGCRVINADDTDYSYDGEISFAEAKDDDISFIINTSGTTGRPKSVAVTHRGLVNCLLQSIDEFGINENDRFIAVTNYCHDMAMYDIFGAFTAGAAMIIPDARRQKEPEHWCELIEKYGVTFWNSVPAFPEMLLDSEPEDAERRLSSVRLMVNGGDVLQVSLARRIKKNFVNARHYNVGGPSETTIWSIWHPVDDSDLSSTFIPYGKPINSGIQYYILSDSGSLCPAGVEGTMYIGGVSLALGYLGLDEETERKFVRFNGKRVYNTGDRGYYLSDGSIKFVGRQDNQVKINGKRIELDGIAETLCGLDSVQTGTAVLDRERNTIVAFYIADEELSAEEMKREMAKILPDYMIPSAFIRLDEMPLTKNGKVDIPSLERKCSEREETIAAAPAEQSSDPVITELSELLCTLLKQKDISISRSFFEMGGNSIYAIRLIAAIRKKWGVTLSVYDIMNNPYVSEWAGLIKTKA